MSPAMPSCSIGVALIFPCQVVMPPDLNGRDFCATLHPGAVNDQLPKHPEYKMVKHKEMKKRVAKMIDDSISDVRTSKEVLLKKEERRLLDQAEEVCSLTPITFNPPFDSSLTTLRRSPLHLHQHLAADH